MGTIASENGLFCNDVKQRKFERIRTNLKEARKDLKHENTTSAQYNVSLAANDYFSEVQTSQVGWRFQNIYAGHIWIYIITFLVSIFLFYHFGVNNLLSHSFKIDETGIDETAIEATTWGIIGSLLRALWKLWYRVNRREYSRPWIVYFASAPFLGGIFGALSYLFIRAGLILLTKQPDLQNHFAIIVFAAFAGYSWENTVKLFTNIGSNFTSQGES